MKVLHMNRIYNLIKLNLIMPIFTALTLNAMEINEPIIVLKATNPETKIQQTLELTPHQINKLGLTHLFEYEKMCSTTKPLISEQVGTDTTTFTILKCAQILLPYIDLNDDQRKFNEQLPQKNLIEIIQLLQAADFLNRDAICDATLNYLKDYLATPLHDASLDTKDLELLFKENLSPTIYNNLRKKLLENLARFQINLYGSFYFSLTPHQGKEVTYAHYNNSGTLFVTACRNGQVKIWDAHTKALIRTLEFHTKAVNTAVFNPIISNMLATASDDNTAVLWDINSGTPIHIMPHPSSVTTGFFSCDGLSLVTTINDYHLKIWDVITGQLNNPPHQFINRISYACFSPNSNIIALCYNDNPPILFDRTTNRAKKINSVFHAADTFAFSHDNTILATGDFLGFLSLYNLKTKQSSLIKDPKKINSITFNMHAPEQLLIATLDGARVYNIVTKECLCNLVGHTASVRSAIYKPITHPSDTPEIMTASKDGTVKFWNLPLFAIALQNNSLAEILSFYYILSAMRTEKIKTVFLDKPENTHLKQLYMSLPMELHKLLQLQIPLHYSSKAQL